MAIIRREQQGRYGTSNCFDAIIESASDLQLPEAAAWREGSLAFCTGDGKLYAKGSNGTWAEVTV